MTNNKLPLSFLSYLFVFLIIFSCDPGTESDEQVLTNYWPDCTECKVLFIGSSYLSYNGNDVVQLFGNFAVAADKNALIGDQVYGGHRLSMHSINQATIAKIYEEDWDFVILQGNSALISKEKWHDQLVPYLIDFKDMIKDSNPDAAVIYMMPWAYLDGMEWMEGETDNYDQMQHNIYNETIKLVKDIDIATAPVGWAWYNVYNAGYTTDMYLSDNNHQGQLGAYLTAAIFYVTVFQEYPPVIDFYLEEESIQTEMHNTANSMVTDNLSLWNIY